MVLPNDKSIKLYVGSWAEWMESVGVSWEDADVDVYYGDCPNYSDEKGTVCECECFDFKCPQNSKCNGKELEKS